MQTQSGEQIFMLTTKKKQKVIKNHQKHEKDTGSAGVQVGILSTRIDELAGHLKKHKKDNSSRRGLIKMVAERRKIMKNLEKSDKKSFDKISKSLK